MVRGYAERNAINAPIQGSAADIIKLAMIAIDRRFAAEGTALQMILQVHDELNFSVVPRSASRWSAFVVEAMEGACALRVRSRRIALGATGWKRTNRRIRLAAAALFTHFFL